MNKRIPSLLHILAAAFVANFLLNLAGIIQLVQSWNWLIAIGYIPHPLYTVFKNAFLALASLAAAGALWARLRIAPLFSQVLAALAFTWFWLDRLLLTSNPQPLRDHLFPLFISLVLLGFFLLSAWLLEPYMRGLPGSSNDHDADEDDDE